MAHHMARVCKFADSLFISDADSAADLALLQEHGITHVVSALPMEPVHKKECKYLIVPVVDSEIEVCAPAAPVLALTRARISSPTSPPPFSSLVTRSRTAARFSFTGTVSCNLRARLSIAAPLASPAAARSASTS